MPAADCHHFLHTNYNCTDLDRLERWYTQLFELKPVMRSSSQGSPGEAFGMYQETSSDTLFVYDHRGGRRATSLEMVRWTDPATSGKPYPLPWNYGIQSVAFAVPELDRVAGGATMEGGQVVRKADKGLLLRDPAGVAVEVVDARVEHPEAHHLRIVCADVDRSVAWYEQLGLQPSPDATVVAGAELWEGDAEHAIDREVAMAASLDPTFSLIFTGWSGSPPSGPTYAMPFHQGLYRMAIAVDDVHATYASLREAGIAKQPPYTFHLPGTPLTDGLTIIFLRDPDGILVELVERPRGFFKA
jgi:catechol 2,3-dioxygenase-like lactoylglutathione lyase family enzyme